MVNKKKFHGGLKLLLSLLFIMLLGMCSTCYAVDYYDFDIPVEFWDAIQDYGNLIYSKSNKILATELETLYNSKKNDFKSVLLNYDSSITDRNLISVVFRDNNELTIYLLINNNTVGNVNDRTKAYYTGSSGYLEMNGPMLVLKAYYGGGVSSTATIQPTSYINNIYISSNFYSKITLSQDSEELLQNTPYFGMNEKPLNVIYASFPKFYNGYKYYILNDYYSINPSPVIPEEPSGETGSTGTITSPSGEITGQIDLSGIESGIKDIKDTISGEGQAIRDTISGESGKVINTLTNVPSLSGEQITSGDIVSALGFDFMADPYDNFWFQMTTGLSAALTNTVRKIPVNWLGYNGFFDLDALGFNYPEPIKNILTTVSTVCMIWVLVKWWKIIIDKLSSGDIDEVLAMNEEERYSRFILGGVKC